MSWQQGRVMSMNNKDYYQLLGVASNATQKDIKEAYRSKAFEFHPDRNQKAGAAAMMQAINEAYAALSDSGKRQHYDSMRRTYGADAHRHFRQTFSTQDIFSNSDFQHIFEEMARSFGLRGYNETFKDRWEKGRYAFEDRKPGFHSGGFVFRMQGRQPSRQHEHRHASGWMGRLALKMLRKAAGLQFPQSGQNNEDIIELTAEFASTGGPYAYFQQARGKKLLVHVPPGVRHGQQIRLAGMGREGSGGAPNGDLYLKVKIKQPLMRRIKALLGF